MKTLHKIFIILAIISLSIACEKEDSEPIETTTNAVTNTTGAKHLRLDNTKRAYYNSENNRYETNTFSADSSSFNYSIAFESGKKYRVLIYGLYMNSINLTLQDLSNNIVVTGEQANVENTAKYIVYESSINDTLLINISADSSYIDNEQFFLSFEEINSYKISWKGHYWDCDGDWEVNSQDQLVFKAYKSGFSKWIKLSDSTLNDYSCDMSFEAPSGKLDNFLGLAVCSSNNIFDMINLPEDGKQFKIKNTNNWELMHINMGGGSGIGREIGDLTNIFNASSNTLSTTIFSDSASFTVNNEFAIKTYIGLNHLNEFYITAEDLGSDSIVISDIKFY